MSMGPGEVPVVTDASGTSYDYGYDYDYDYRDLAGTDSEADVIANPGDV